MKPYNNEIKGRKIASFFENIFKSIPSILLGSILFALIFLGYFLLSSKIQKGDIEYAGVMSISIKYNSGCEKKVGKDEFVKAMNSDEVKEMLSQEISTQKSMSNILSDAQVEFSDDVFDIAFFNNDETYAKTVVTKIYNAVSVVLMNDYDISTIEIEKPVYFKVYDRTGGYIDSLGIKGFTLLGAAIGAVFSLVIICTFYLLDNTIKNAVDVKRYFDLPVLAIIPEVKDKEEE